MSSLYLVRGIPGSGKSTFAHNYLKGIYVLENDMMLMENGVYNFSPSKRSLAIEWCMKSAEIALKCGMDVCVCNTFTKKDFIIPYKKLSEKYGANFKVYRMAGNFTNVHNVPTNVLANMKNNFEDWPTEIVVTPTETGYDL